MLATPYNLCRGASDCCGATRAASALRISIAPALCSMRTSTISPSGSRPTRRGGSCRCSSGRSRAAFGPRAQQEIDNLAKGIDHIQHLANRQHVHDATRGAIETVRAEALVAQAMRMSASEADDGITFLPAIEVDAPLAVEKHKLLAVLINMLRNAHHASFEVPADRRTIRIDVRETGKGMVRFSVIDQGVGIAAENLARIFRGGFTTKGEGKGQGLGLHGCANSVAEMGGRMWVESDGEGRGARFHVELPAVVPGHAPNAQVLAGTGAVQ